MLEASLHDEMLTDTDAMAAAPSRAVAHAAPASMAAAARYGAGRGVNLPAALAVIVVHLLLVVALVQMRAVYVKKKEAALELVNLTPAPPPPAEETPPPPAPPEVVAPPPIVRTPLTMAPTVMTTPDPVPVIAPVVAPAAPAPVMAPPAAPSTIQANDLMARMLAGKAPRYPTESRRKREQGTVVLSLVLGTDGRVASISVAQSSGFARLDDAARDAVRGWRWEPMIRNGAPVQVKGLVEIPFIIKT